jgi:hypothetical protein
MSHPRRRDICHGAGARAPWRLFKGVEISVESLRSLVAGGVAFATPDATSPPAKEGTIFVLHDKPQKEWLTWAPKIRLPAGN